MATPHDPAPAALALVGASAGIGKTILAEATLAEAAAQGALALVGRHDFHRDGEGA